MIFVVLVSHGKEDILVISLSCSVNCLFPFIS